MAVSVADAFAVQAKFCADQTGDAADDAVHEFVARVRPQHVVFTVGYRNRFGHPNAEVLERYRDRFRYILVDEYQDTNRLQSSILLAMKPEGRGLTVVGDDAHPTLRLRVARRFDGHCS